MKGLRVVFMGSPGFAVPIAEAVRDLGCEIVAVYAAPDRPAGRGRKLQPAPVKQWALGQDVPVLTPMKLSPLDEQARFQDLGPDLVVLAAYGLLLPKTFLFSPPHGAVNVHPSVLPKYRGAAPVAGAILEGDHRTGTSIMVMDEGLDTGPVLGQAEVALDGTERTPALTNLLFRLGAELLADCLPRYVAGELRPWPQPTEGVSVLKRFKKEDGVLDWGLPAEQLERRVRALDPWPGTATTWEGRRLEVLEAWVGKADGNLAPGTVVPADKGAGIATGNGVLVLGRVKLEGRPATTVQEFLRGHGAFVGSVLPS